jgi:hypothetical protein
MTDEDQSQFGDDRSILGNLSAEELPKPQGLRLVFVDGREVIWRSHNRGLVEWSGFGSSDDGDAA